MWLSCIGHFFLYITSPRQSEPIRWLLCIQALDVIIVVEMIMTCGATDDVTGACEFSEVTRTERVG